MVPTRAASTALQPPVDPEPGGEGPHSGGRGGLHSQYTALFTILYTTLHITLHNAVYCTEFSVTAIPP